MKKLLITILIILSFSFGNTEIDINAHNTIYNEDTQHITPELVHPRYGKLWIARVDGFTKERKAVYGVSAACKTKKAAIRQAAIKCFELGGVYKIRLLYLKSHIISLAPPHTH